MLLSRSSLYIFIACAMNLLLCAVVGAYQVDRYPFETMAKVTANYGEYRVYKNKSGDIIYTGGHEGIDLALPRSTPIYPLANGKVKSIQYPPKGTKTGYGRYVVIDHNGYETLYAHLDEIARDDHGALPTVGDSVSSSKAIGFLGDTGNSFGPHLHFQVGSQAQYGNEENPLVAGLVQAEVGEAKIVANINAPFYEGEFIKILSPGLDGKYDGHDITINYPEPNKPARIVIEAYDFLKSGYPSNPYKVEFDIKKIFGNGEDYRPDAIEFNKRLSIINTNIKKYYDLESYFRTRPYAAKIYFYTDWTPKEGLYRITAKVYSAYRDSTGFHIQDDPDIHERIVTVGITGVDYPFYDLAQNPNTPRENVTTVAGIRAAVAGSPQIYYTDISNTYFSISPGDPEFQKSTWISARADKSVNWEIKIKDNSNNLIKTMTDTGTMINREWNGAGEGTYYYQIIAKDTASSAEATEYGPDSITIDNTRPDISIKSDPTACIATIEDEARLSFSSNEDLYSVVIDLVDVSGTPIIDYLATNPQLKGSEIMDVVWGGPGLQPNGWYFFKITATDMAGNQTVRNIPVKVNLPDQPAPPDIQPDPSIVRKIPPEETKNIVVGDMAFDDKGNQYILYTNKFKVVKYDGAGKAIGIIDSFSTGTGSLEGLWYPLSLAVSPAGDRVYVTDTYADRVLVYDQDLAPLKEIRGQYAYKESHKGKHHDEYCIVVRSGDCYPEPSTYHEEEGFDLPEDVVVGASGGFCVVDTDKNRILKYDRDGEPLMFSRRIADFKNEVQKMWDDGVEADMGLGYTNTVIRKNDFLIARKYDYYDIYSNSLNDQVRFVKADISDFYHVGSGSQFKSPQSVAVDASGDIYVTDTGNNRIQKFNSDGEFLTAFGESELSSPKGIEVDSYGNIFVADTGNQRIVQFGPTGNFIQEYKSDEYEIDPQKLVVRNGKLYIADANHDRPLVWDIGGEITNFKVADPWFSPNSDGLKDDLIVVYDLSQPANVTLQPLPTTSEGTTVQSVYQKYALNDESRLIGHQQETWNGILVADSGGQGDGGAEQKTIADGNYQLKLVASFGDYQKTRTADIHVDTTAPEVSLTRDPPAISPNSDSINDALTITYSVSDNLAPSSEVRLSFYKDNRAVGLLQDMTEPLPVASRGIGWNGTFTGYVNEGYYILELEATDLAGNVATATQEVLVDNSAPRIENVTLSNPYFSPNNDGRKDATEISFNLLDTYARTMIVTVLVRNEQGEEAAELARQIELAPGQHSFIWDGSPLPEMERGGTSEASDGVRVADGSYSIKIYAEDEAGNLGNSEPAEVVVDTLPPSVESFAAGPNPFTPNNDGVKDTTLISFTLSEPCNSELRILRDDNVTLFRDQLYYDVSSASFGWNGSGEHAEVLGQEHPFYLYAEDRAGNVTTSETQTIIVDHEPSLVPYIYADPDPFAPVNPANAQTTIKYYLVRDGLTIDLEVLGQDDRVVKTLIANEPQNKGEQSITWSGDFDPGYDGPRASADSSKVADGSWQFRITAAASDEPNPAVTTNTVVVDNVAPYLLAENFNVDQVSCSADLTYSLPENASLEVAAYDSSDSLLETVESLNYKTAGSHTVSWQPGTPPAGTAYLKVSAIDRARNSTELKTELFALVAQGELAVTDLNASPDPFTPNGDGLIDLTQISYQVSGGAPEYNVGLVIETESGATVKTMLQNEPQNSGYYSFIWDGKNDSGHLVSDGDYQIVLTVKDKLGASVVAQSGMLLVSTRPSLDLSISPSVISPNNDGNADSSTFTYSIDYPVAYITGEALIKLDVLAATGEALWSRTFNNTPGTYVYAYDGKKTNGDPLPAGNFYVKATAQDALGATAVPKTVDLAVDYTMPEPSDFIIDPIYTKLGTVMNISLSFAEELAETPTVMLYMPDESSREAVFVSQSGTDYVFNYTVVEGDAEGNGVIEVIARDLADNPISRTKGFVVDTTQPTLSSISVAPNPAGIPSVSGQVSIQFNVSEPLQSVPKVYVRQSGAAVQQALVSGDWNMAGGTCVGKYDVISGFDGPVLITIEAIDLSGNIFVDSLPNSLIADTINPVFSNIRSEIAANLDFSTYAKEGSSVTISFKSSESLQFNPEVRVNGETADYVSLTAGEYVYSYTVDGYDSEGNAEISITGQDLAGNQGSVLTSSSSESFVIDLTNPLVDIAEPETDMIANPSPFMTNGQPGVDALQTTLYYTISEQGYVTIGVHKVPDAQLAYTRDDFTSANQVHSFDLGWQTAGQRHVDWTGVISQNAGTYDENSNGYVDPGKHAFIVEVRDRAGNLVEGKWGGTCWIQDNVLALVEPDRTVLGHDNPQPKYFSPNGDTNNDSTEIFFRVNLGITPPEALRPEKISVLSAGIDWETTEIKPIGSYTIRIYDASTSSLVRTLVSDKELMSNKVLSEIWDGKDNGGSYVPEGTYSIEIDARDYLAGEAMGNLLTLTATVDVTAPTVDSHEPQTAGDTAWINSSRTFDVDLYDQHNAFASKLNIADYKVVRPDSSDSGWQSIFSTLEAGSYTANWGDGVFGQAENGVNTVYVKVNDLAGNETETVAFYVRKDDENPSSTTPATTSPTNDQTPTWTWSASTDNYSGVEGYYIIVGTTDGGADVVPETWIGSTTSWTHTSSLADGIYYARIKAKDNAENIGPFANSGSVLIDTHPPVISGLSPISFDPYVNGPLTVGFTASDPAPSSGFAAADITANIEYGVNVVKSNLTAVPDGGINFHVVWNGTNDFGDYENEGTYALELSAYDTAGNVTSPIATSITIIDDQKICSDRSSPKLTRTGNNLTLAWINGVDDSLIRETTAEASTGWVAWDENVTGSSPPFYIDHAQDVTIKCEAHGEAGEDHYIFTSDGTSTSGGTQVWWRGGTGGGESIDTLTLSAGWYYAHVRLKFVAGSGGGYTKVSFVDRKFNEYTCSSPDLGRIWGSISGMDKVDDHLTGPRYIFDPEPNLIMEGTPPFLTPVFVYSSGTKVYDVYSSSGNLFYRKGLMIAEYRSNYFPASPATIPSDKISWSGSVEFVKSGAASALSASIEKDEQENIYVAWEDARNGTNDIYFQRIPYNMARLTGTFKGAFVIDGNKMMIQATTFEAPTLIAPDDSADVDSIRPTFQWDHHKGNTAEYKIDLAKNDLFSIDNQTFIKSENTGSVDQADPTLFHFTYAVHEFDPGLDRDTYYWRVTAYTTNEAATSEVRSFAVAPELSLSGVTNYPNPFDPRRNTTKIRYRLGTDVDSVVVRIYDIAGALVVELDNCPTEGEGSSVWQKYSDVEWDGRNGRGDLVVNGIYPFEVIARLGDRSMSARGKIAVLK